MSSKLIQYNPSRELPIVRAASVVTFSLYKLRSQRAQNRATPQGSVNGSQFGFQYKQTEGLYSNDSQLVIPLKSTPWAIPLRTNKTYCIVSFEVHFTNTVEIQVMKWNEMNQIWTFKDRTEQQ